MIPEHITITVETANGKFRKSGYVNTDGAYISVDNEVKKIARKAFHNHKILKITWQYSQSAFEALDENENRIKNGVAPIAGGEYLC